MKLVDTAKRIFREQVRKAFDPLENIDLNNVVGWRSVGGSSAFGYYQDNQYENGYSSISKLANGFAQTEPYTIDKNGKAVASNLLDRIYTPNTDMSAYDFREALAVTTLVHDKVRLKVHHKGTRINVESILGFTFMEGYTENIVGGKRQYRMGNGETLTDAEVITLKSVNPNEITEGFSPSRAAKRWTGLDDYIADYQKGFFANGAVPAGQMIITARTTGEFNDIVDTLQARHRGAGKSNNVTYTHRPTDQEGKPMNSQIEWIPFSTNNKDLALKDLFDNVNKKIDSVYGVPQEIRGHLSNSNYASVSVAEKVFVKYALYPMTLKIWSKFTHEVNRVTGGAGVGISFDMEIPVVADETKIESESKQIEAGLINTLITGGFSLDTIVDAFQLPNSYKLLRSDNKKPVIVNDKPEVLSPEEAKGTPDQPLDIYSKKVKVKQVAAREMPGLYDDLMIDGAMVKDESLRGCIMLKTEALDVLSTVEDGASDLAQDVLMDRSPVPGETSPHVTLLFGLLNNGNIWKDAVDQVLEGWKADTVTIDEVGFFTLPDSYAIVAHVKKTTELVDAHDRLGLLPNAETFSEYKPHITLAYIKKEADLGKWIKALGEVYNGQELETAGLDYGDLPEASKSVASKQLSDIDKELYEFQFSRIVRRQMSRQVEKAIQKLDQALAKKAFGDTDEEEDKEFTSELLALMLPLMTIYGNRTVNTGMNIVLQAGLSTNNIQKFEFTPAQRKVYEKYLGRIGTGYADQTAEQIRSVLGRGILDGASKAEIEGALRSVILGPENEYRVLRLARTEINLSEGKASVYAMENIQEQTGYSIYKEWHTSSTDPCPFCDEMDGTSVLVSESFVPLGETVRAGDQTFLNNWTDVDSAELHANCNCYTTYRVEEG